MFFDEPKNFFSVAVDSVGSPIAASIVQSIDDEFRIQDGVDNEDFHVSAKKGIVTIKGVAQNILEKERAVQIAKATRGVRGVIDNITVKVTDITDQKLKEDVVHALRQDPATDAYDIRVEVNNGAVKLAGRVDS